MNSVAPSPHVEVCLLSLNWYVQLGYIHEYVDSLPMQINLGQNQIKKS